MKLKMPPFHRKFYARLSLLIVPAILLFVVGVMVQSGQGSKTITTSKEGDLYIKNGQEIQKPDLPSRGNDDARAEAKEKEFFKGKLVAVDAGHGGVDSGTCFEDIEEKNINLDVALKLEQILKAKGIGVLMTRTTDDYVGLVKRSEMANTANVDLFASVHCNSVENLDESCKGTTTLYKSKDHSGRNGMDSKTFAENVQQQLIKALGTYDNGELYKPSLSVLRLGHMPSIIAELGYISNPEDRANLTNPAFQQNAAQALADGIMKTLKDMYGFIDSNSN